MGPIKIIALLPVRNESWILPTFISSVKNIVDEIIAIDDFSTDNSAEILKTAGATVIQNPYPSKKGWAEYKIRQKLLDLGREHGGTHFICIDADEALTGNFVETGLPYIKNMKRGERISLRWLALWKSPLVYRDDDSAWSNLYKTVIFCDDGISNFIEPQESTLVSEVGQKPHSFGPTPHVTSGSATKMPLVDGSLLHYQFANWEYFQWKQVQKRCLELIQRPTEAKRINNTYSITLDSKAQCTEIPRHWLTGITPSPGVISSCWSKDDVLKWVDEYGIDFFEPLEIWHIPELNERFISAMGRGPIIQRYPTWLVQLNKVRNKIRYILFPG